MNIDIKGDAEAVLKFCNADVERVWKNAVAAKRRGVWVEITTLLIPGINDKYETLREIARRIKYELGDDTPWRVVTHAHWDHIVGLETSIGACEAILMTPATRDILEVIRGKRLLSSPKIQTLAYTTPTYWGSKRITFYEAGHIPGSAQVVVQTDDGTRVTYTGDFKLPRASILH